MLWKLRGLLLVLVACGGGCSLSDKVGVLSMRDAGTDGGMSGEVDGGADAGTDGGTDVGSDPRLAYCARSGPAWSTDPKLKRETCGGHLVARVFKQAVCSRVGIVASAPFTTHTVSGQASVWSGGFFSSKAGTTIGGSLQVDSSAPGSFELTGDLSVSGSLLIGASLDAGTSSVQVGEDMKVAGDVYLDSLEAGVLSVPEASALVVNQGFPTDKVRREPVGSFTPACPVDSFEEIGAWVAQNQPLNHDSTIGLEPTEFEDVSTGHTRSLPCGRFYLTRIGGGLGSAQLSITGKTTLFVGGSVDVDSLELTVHPGVDLDLFVAGDLLVHKQLRMTSNFEPWHLRVYVQGALNVPADHLLQAQIYAPNANLVMGDDLNVDGSLFVQRLDASAPVYLYFDPRILQVESTCTE